jgi:hypothetical protein
MEQMEIAIYRYAQGAWKKSAAILSARFVLAWLPKHTNDQIKNVLFDAAQCALPLRLARLESARNPLLMTQHARAGHLPY